MFEIVEISVLFHIYLIHSLELSFKSLIFVHESRFDVHEALEALLSSFQITTFLFYFFFEASLLFFHIGDVLREFCHALVLLLDDFLDASFDVGLVVCSIGTATHPIEETKGLLPTLS